MTIGVLKISVGTGRIIAGTSMDLVAGAAIEVGGAMPPAPAAAHGGAPTSTRAPSTAASGSRRRRRQPMSLMLVSPSFWAYVPGVHTSIAAA